MQVTTDVVALLDEWAARFFEELDYVKEGQNATLFAQQMAQDLPQVGTNQPSGLFKMKLHTSIGIKRASERERVYLYVWYFVTASVTHVPLLQDLR